MGRKDRRKERINKEKENSLPQLKEKMCEAPGRKSSLLSSMSSFYFCGGKNTIVISHVIFVVVVEIHLRLKFMSFPSLILCHKCLANAMLFWYLQK